MYKTSCFAFKRGKTGVVTCSALKHIDCDNCKFFRTKKEYKEKVLDKLKGNEGKNYEV